MSSPPEAAIDLVIKIERLAALDPIGYEAVRVKEAERLSFRISVLDKLVAQKRRALVLGSHDRQGRWRHYCLGR